MASDAEKEKMPMPWKIEASLNSMPWNRESVQNEVNTEKSPTKRCYAYSYMAILTASSKRDPPKMMLYSLGSTLY